MRVEGVNSVVRMAPMKGLARAGKPSPPEVSSPPKPVATPVARAQKAVAASRKDASNPFAQPRPPVDVDVREFLSMTAQLLTRMAATRPHRVGPQLDLHV